MTGDTAVCCFWRFRWLKCLLLGLGGGGKSGLAERTGGWKIFIHVLILAFSTVPGALSTKSFCQSYFFLSAQSKWFRGVLQTWPQTNTIVCYVARVSITGGNGHNVEPFILLSFASLCTTTAVWSTVSHQVATSWTVSPGCCYSLAGLLGFTWGHLTQVISKVAFRVKI